MRKNELRTDCCQLVDWYAQGESHTVEVDGVCIVIRLVGRKGRRARIAITAPPGARFSTPSGSRMRQPNSSALD